LYAQGEENNAGMQHGPLCALDTAKPDPDGHVVAGVATGWHYYYIHTFLRRYPQ